MKCKICNSEMEVLKNVYYDFQCSNKAHPLYKVNTKHYGLDFTDKYPQETLYFDNYQIINAFDGTSKIYKMSHADRGVQIRLEFAIDFTIPPEELKNKIEFYLAYS